MGPSSLDETVILHHYLALTAPGSQPLAECVGGRQLLAGRRAGIICTIGVMCFTLSVYEIQCHYMQNYVHYDKYTAII